MSTQKTLSSRAWGELILLALIWGASFLTIRIALDEVPVLWVVAHRVGWAAIILWAVALIRKETLPRGIGPWAACLAMGLLNNVIPFGLMAWGQLYVETGLTSILNAATAIFGVLVATIVFSDEALTPRRSVGTVLGFLGVSVAVGLDNLIQFDPRALGQIAILAGAFSYALAGAWARVNLSGLSPIVAAAGMLTGSTLVIVPAALIFEGAPEFALAPKTWLSIAYFAVISTAFAYLLYYRILAMAGAGNLLLCTLLIPPVAILLGALVLDEALTASAFVGFGILATGLLVLDGRIIPWCWRLVRRSS